MSVRAVKVRQSSVSIPRQSPRKHTISEFANTMLTPKSNDQTPEPNASHPINQLTQNLDDTEEFPVKVEYEVMEEEFSRANPVSHSSI